MQGAKVNKPCADKRSIGIFGGRKITTNFANVRITTALPYDFHLALQYGNY